MSYFEFPNTRTYEGDLGYIIKKLMELTDKYNTFFEYNSIKFADPILWDITKQYPAYVIVFAEDTEGAYISKKPVPAGINITSDEYWCFIGPLVIDSYARTQIEKILDFITNITESGSIATEIRYPGEYVLSAGSLYIVTDTINIGEGYTPGINVTATTIENMIHDIYNIEVSKIYVTPEMFGAIGNGTADDRAAFIAALATGKKVICAPNKTYALNISSDANIAILMPSNSHLDLNGSTLKVINPDDLSNAACIAISGESNSIIENGKLLGERTTHIGDTGEHFHGLSIFESSNITVRNLYISNFWGDGVYIGGTDSIAKDIIIDNIHCYNNRRNGLSLINGNNIKIVNSTFEATNGTNPQLGIDIESNSSADTLTNICIDNCSFINNEKGGFSIYSLGAGTSITISDIISSGDVSCNLMANNGIVTYTNAIINGHFYGRIDGAYSKILGNNISVKPAIAPDDGFMLSCSENSAINIINSICDLANTPRSVLYFNEHQAHKNITIKAKVQNGSASRPIIAYSNEQTNCDIYFDINKNVSFTEQGYGSFNAAEKSNNVIFDYFVTQTTRVMSGSYSKIVIPVSSTESFFYLWYQINSRDTHYIYNTDAVDHELRQATFVNMVDGTSAATATIPAGKNFIYTVIGNLVYYVIA